MGESLPSFLRDKVATVRRVGIPGIKAPGTPEGVPRTAAIERYCGHKKSACNTYWRCDALIHFRFLHLVADFAATSGEYPAEYKAFKTVVCQNTQQAYPLTQVSDFAYNFDMKPSYVLKKNAVRGGSVRD